MNREILNFKGMLEMAKEAIGEENLFNLHTAVIMEVYLDELLTNYTNEEFNRICNYVHGIYTYNSLTNLDSIAQCVRNYLEHYTLENLESISYDDFIYEILVEFDEDLNILLNSADEENE